MGFAQKGGRAIAVTRASAKKVRRQKNLKIFLPKCSCQPERAAVRSPVREVRWSVCRNAFCLPRNCLRRIVRPY